LLIMSPVLKWCCWLLPLFWNRNTDCRLLLCGTGDILWPGCVWNISLDESCMFGTNPWLWESLFGL
jgi:hypothetical protein